MSRKPSIASYPSCAQIGAEQPAIEQRLGFTTPEWERPSGTWEVRTDAYKAAYRKAWRQLEHDSNDEDEKDGGT